MAQDFSWGCVYDNGFANSGFYNDARIFGLRLVVEQDLSAGDKLNILTLL
jgi:hypothetical protein